MPPLAIKNLRRIAVFRALHLGDLLCAVPALRALRHAAPRAQITLIGLPWARDFASRYASFIDDFLVFPGLPGLPEQNFNPQKTLAFLNQTQQFHFDLLLQMQGSGQYINLFVPLMGARRSAGFFYNGSFLPDPELYISYPEKEHEINRHLALVKHLGVPVFSPELEFPVKEEDREAFRTLFPDLARERFVVVHPGSRDKKRQWPPDLFALLADELAEAGYDIVISGTAAETELAATLAAKMKHPARVAAGHTSLGSMAALLEASAGMLANCTGVSHLAAALGVKSVIVSMDGEPQRWAPLNRQLHQVIDWCATPHYAQVRNVVRAIFIIKNQG